MSCLLALIKPDSGTITIGGISPNDLAVREIIGFMPERPNFEGWLTPVDFLRMHHLLARQNKEGADADIEEALTRVGLEKNCWKRIIRTFSRGMLQRLGLAQALIGKPKILFLDEPGSGMDPPGNVLLRQLFAQFKRDQITVVLNSHHLDEMERVCDRVAFIQAGKIEALESLEEMASQPYVLDVGLLKQIEGDSVNKFVDAAKLAGAQLIQAENSTAKFLVSHPEAAAIVIQQLVLNGILLKSAQPEQTVLERLFDPAAPQRTTGSGT
jgi:ABC-2 type transport system ATP-binding protein